MGIHVPSSLWISFLSFFMNSLKNGPFSAGTGSGFLSWCSTSTETIRLIRDGEGGMEVGEEGDCIPVATLSPPEGLQH